MGSFTKKIKWFLRRHPIWYYIRFVLICRNFKGDLNDLPTFNDINKKEDAPQIFFDINKNIDLSHASDTWEKALAIAIYLRKIIKGGRGLGYSSGKALKEMIAGNGGVCSDYSQIFNVFCLINDIRVREWGLVERFYNALRGHTFNEVWSEKLQKWCVIDVGKNLYFSTVDDNPASAIELFSYLRKGNPLRYHYFSDHRCIDMYKIDKTYAADVYPFVISNYVNKEYDFYLDKFQKLPSFAVNALMIFRGKNYNFLFPMDNYKSKLY